MSSPDKFYLRVTAGASYTTHTPVPVNTASPLTIETPSSTIQLLVSIRDFRGPPSSSPTSPHFHSPGRKSARYSIAFRLLPKQTINGDALVLGNDFDGPITEYLPPFFGTALSVVKRVLDPGIDGDPYAEKPYLYGPVLSSVNVLRVEEEEGGEFGKKVVEEGREGERVVEMWEREGIPRDGAGRAKFFLNAENRKRFRFERGWCYEFDFFNGYLDFNGEWFGVERWC
jgi:hypothetical protein